MQPRFVGLVSLLVADPFHRIVLVPATTVARALLADRNDRRTIDLAVARQLFVSAVARIKIELQGASFHHVSR